MIDYQDCMNIQNNNANSSQRKKSEIYGENNTDNNNINIASIKENKNNTDFLSKKVDLTENNKNPTTYYCKNCNTFPEIKIKDNNSLNFSCVFEKNLEINFKTLFNCIITKKESEEDLKKKLICKTHSKVFECYCCDCKKNLCVDCYNDVEHNLKTEKEKTY